MLTVQYLYTPMCTHYTLHLCMYLDYVYTLCVATYVSNNQHFTLNSPCTHTSITVCTYGTYICSCTNSYIGTVAT